MAAWCRRGTGVRGALRAGEIQYSHPAPVWHTGPRDTCEHINHKSSSALDLWGPALSVEMPLRILSEEMRLDRFLSEHAGKS